MAEYPSLIYGDESRWEDADAMTFDPVMAGDQALSRKHKAAQRGAHALQPTATATSAPEEPSGAFSVSDAPFAETKEAPSSYYLVQADNVDEASAMAKDVPPPFGGIELRPARTFG